MILTGTLRGRGGGEAGMIWGEVLRRGSRRVGGNRRELRTGFSSHRGRIALTFLQMAFAFIFSAGTQALGAVAYQAQGVLRYEKVRAIEGQSPKVLNTNVFYFEWTRYESIQWSVTIRDSIEGMTPEPFESTREVVYDGKDIFELFSSPARILGTPNEKGEIAIEFADSARARQTAAIHRGPFPASLDSPVGVLWLAFMAGEYLDPSDNLSVMPNPLFTNGRIIPLAWASQLEYTLDGPRTHPVLQKGTFLLDSSLVGKHLLDHVEINLPQTPDEMYQLQVQHDAISGLDGERVEVGRYELLRTASVSQYTMPTEFRCSAPSPSRLLQSDADVTGHFHGQVSNVTTIEVSGLVMPSIQDSVYVKDERLRVKTKDEWRPYVLYPTDHWISDTNDPIVVAAAASQPPRPHPVVPKRRGRTVAIILLACAIVIPGLALWRAYVIKRS
jgi:hypothetical protein